MHILANTLLEDCKSFTSEIIQVFQQFLLPAKVQGKSIKSVCQVNLRNQYLG